MRKKTCLKCKEPYYLDGYDWGICPICTREMLTNVRREIKKLRNEFIRGNSNATKD